MYRGVLQLQLFEQLIGLVTDDPELLQHCRLLPPYYIVNRAGLSCLENECQILHDLSKPKYILDKRVYFVIVLDQIHLAVLWLPIISKYGYVPTYHFVSCFIGGYNENLGLGDVICIARSNKVSICCWIDTQSAKNNKSCSCQYNLHDLASSVSGQTLAQ